MFAIYKYKSKKKDVSGLTRHSKQLRSGFQAQPSLGQTSLNVNLCLGMIAHATSPSDEGKFSYLLLFEQVVTDQGQRLRAITNLYSHRHWCWLYLPKHHGTFPGFLDWAHPKQRPRSTAVPNAFTLRCYELLAFWCFCEWGISSNLTVKGTVRNIHDDKLWF